MALQLEQLNREIAAHFAKLKAATEAWLNAEDLQKKADLKEVYEDAKKTDDWLLQDREALIAKLPSPGEPTLLQHLDSSSKVCGFGKLVCDWSCNIVELSAGKDVSHPGQSSTNHVSLAETA